MFLIVLPDIAAEDRLLAQARQGNQDAVMRIYDSYFPPIYNFIRLRVDDRAAAEDLASEVFVELVTALQNRKGPRHSLRGWLFQVARNLLHDHYKTSVSTAVLEEWVLASAEDEPEGQALRALDVDRTRQAMRMLAEDQQQVLVLRFWQGLSLEETADIMGRRVGAVKSLQFRAVNT
ncbi:MAG: sigma-70 family RNA polymerase sigma factor, partial [Anaerolineae bacterium]|nr:sigma-70 family RNA polymerase sigma factor [Anaerolineae bacterium]